MKEKKILLVDNNPVILKLLSRTLELKGYAVQTAVDGLSALEALKSYHPDVLITDLIMPNIDGNHLCRIVRNKNEFSEMVIIILSAIAAEENYDFRRIGADACIAKGPAKEMEKHIEAVLNASSTKTHEEVLGVERVYKRQITTELLSKKKHFEITLESMGDGFLELSPDRKVTYCNSKGTVFFNCPQEQILASNFLDLFSLEQQDVVEQNLAQLDDQPCVFGEQNPISINGRLLRFKVIPVKTEHEHCFIVLVRDITKQKSDEDKINASMLHLEEMVEKRTAEKDLINRELELKIAEREEMNKELEFVANQWSTTFDTIPDFISVLDKDMRYVRINKTLANFLGKKPEDLLGQYYYQVMFNKEQPLDRCPHRLAMDEKRSIRMEIDDPHVGFPILVTCSPLFHDDGSLLGSISVARDISQQKIVEQEREDLIKQLQNALSKVKLLSGIIPICSSCKKIRDDQGYWNQVESYIRKHSEAEFSHGICPDCAKELYPDLFTSNDS